MHFLFKGYRVNLNWKRWRMKCRYQPVSRLLVELMSPRSPLKKKDINHLTFCRGLCSGFLGLTSDLLIYSLLVLYKNLRCLRLLNSRKDIGTHAFWIGKCRKLNSAIVALPLHQNPRRSDPFCQNDSLFHYSGIAFNLKKMIFDGSLYFLVSNR